MNKKIKKHIAIFSTIMVFVTTTISLGTTLNIFKSWSSLNTQLSNSNKEHDLVDDNTGLADVTSKIAKIGISNQKSNYHLGRVASEEKRLGLLKNVGGVSDSLGGVAGRDSKDGGGNQLGASQGNPGGDDNIDKGDKGSTDPGLTAGVYTGSGLGNSAGDHSGDKYGMPGLHVNADGQTTYRDISDYMDATGKNVDPRDEKDCLDRMVYNQGIYNAMSRNTAALFASGPGPLIYGYNISYDTYNESTGNLNKEQQSKIINAGDSNVELNGVGQPETKGNIPGIPINQLFNLRLQMRSACQSWCQVRRLNSTSVIDQEFQNIVPGSYRYNIVAKGVATDPTIQLCEAFTDSKTGKTVENPVGQFDVYNFFTTNFHWTIGVIITLISIIATITFAKLMPAFVRAIANSLAFDAIMASETVANVLEGAASLANRIQGGLNHIFGADFEFGTNLTKFADEVAEGGADAFNQGMGRKFFGIRLAREQGPAESPGMGWNLRRRWNNYWFRDARYRMTSDEFGEDGDITFRLWAYRQNQSWWKRDFELEPSDWFLPNMRRWFLEFHPLNYVGGGEEGASEAIRVGVKMFGNRVSVGSFRWI